MFTWIDAISFALMDDEVFTLLRCSAALESWHITVACEIIDGMLPLVFIFHHDQTSSFSIFFWLRKKDISARGSFSPIVESKSRPIGDTLAPLFNLAFVLVLARFSSVNAFERLSIWSSFSLSFFCYPRSLSPNWFNSSSNFCSSKSFKDFSNDDTSLSSVGAVLGLGELLSSGFCSSILRVSKCRFVDISSSTIFISHPIHGTESKTNGNIAEC